MAKAAATGYSKFTGDNTPNDALQDSQDAATSGNNMANNATAQRKKAIKKRLMGMKGN